MVVTLYVVECESEVVAQKLGTTILFRRIHSGDVKSDSEKCWLHTTSHVSVLPVISTCFRTVKLQNEVPHS